MNRSVALWAVVLLLPLSEIGLAILRRAGPGVARRADEGSTRLLWLVILAAVAVAVATQWIAGMRLPGGKAFLQWLALVLLCSGLALRWVAVVSLGRYFTVDVAIHEGHTLVDRGVYRYVRHPSYTGLLVAFAGLGVVAGGAAAVYFATSGDTTTSGTPTPASPSR